ncbi:hypothetical protein WJX84_000021 [Apatococcus fuscideae]|uniref:RRM domain-containing protein n=1 Tax=Apatococcus fuscideae TaxID=2026836 RepID=A0AAW1SQV3_9CHLO
MASYPSYPAEQYAQPYAQPAADPYHAAAAYAAPAYAPAPAAYGYNPDELRTVFLTGFPDDVKERELNNLLRFLPGYEASQMHWKNSQAQGFALFQHGGAARAAIDNISNLVFDEGAVLRSYAPVTNTKDNPPCNTLFIGNLGDTVNEAEIRGLFANAAGFRQLKLIRGQKSTTCFVEFADVPTAMACHAAQQGAVLTSSDRGGVRIQFSKNPFGKKRDYGGNYVQMPGDWGSASGYTAPAADAATTAVAPPGVAPEANGAVVKTDYGAVKAE